MEERECKITQLGLQKKKQKQYKYMKKKSQTSKA
jgi:hypothetical protein